MKTATKILKFVASLLMFASFLPAHVKADTQSISFKPHLITNVFSDSTGLFAGDLNNDNYIDIIGSARSTLSVTLFKNDGNQNFSAQLVGNDWGAHTFDGADMDGDGDIDLAAGNNYHVVWFENLGNETFARYHIYTDVYHEISYVEIVDLDSDGDQDIISNGIGWYRSKIRWYENDGHQNFTMHEIIDVYSPNNWGCRSVVPVKLDNDDDWDIITSCDETPIFWLKNDGNQNFSRQDINPDRIVEAGVRTNVQPIDMDLDGDTDILFADYYQGTFWLENDGILNFTEHQVSLNHQDTTHIKATDLDDDGDIDIVEPTNGLKRISAWINDGNMNFTESIIGENLESMWDVFVVDLDRDGDQDVIADEAPKGLTWFETNRSPMVDSGQSYSVYEGEVVSVNATGSDPDGGAVSYSWDLDNDGTFETPGQSVDFSAENLIGPQDYPITVQVTDDKGLTAVDQANIHVLETIRFNFTGFFQPVDNLPLVNQMNAGRTVPIKFSLDGYQGMEIFASGYPVSGPMSCSNTLTDNVEQTLFTDTSTLTYDASTDQYIYLWRTEKTWAGTCRFFLIKLSDRTYHQIYFMFK